MANPSAAGEAVTSGPSQVANLSADSGDVVGCEQQSVDLLQAAMAINQLPTGDKANMQAVSTM